MGEKANAFCQFLAYITVDRAYLIWSWRKFCKKFSHISIFLLLFLKVLIMVVSAIITTNTLQYIKKTLYFKTPRYFYQKLLECLNITYIITSIISFDFDNLNFLIIPKIEGISNIKKIMIFINGIKENIVLKKHL